MWRTANQARKRLRTATKQLLSYCGSDPCGYGTLPALDLLSVFHMRCFHFVSVVSKAGHSCGCQPHEPAKKEVGTLCRPTLTRRLNPFPSSHHAGRVSPETRNTDADSGASVPARLRSLRWFWFRMVFFVLFLKGLLTWTPQLRSHSTRPHW